MAQIIQTILNNNDERIFNARQITQINYNNVRVISIDYLVNSNQVLVNDDGIIFTLHSPDIPYLTYRDVLLYLDYLDHRLVLNWVNNNEFLNILNTRIIDAPLNQFSLYSQENQPYIINNNHQNAAGW